MPKKIVIVGGVAGGASVAARARRLDENAEVIMFEKGPNVSFSNCSLPFFLSRIVKESGDLVLMSPEQFKKQYNIVAKTSHEVFKVNAAQKTVTVKDLSSGKEFDESYDTLVLSPGASPLMPRAISGIEQSHVFSVRNVVDIKKIDDYVTEHSVNDIVVVGGGFIGIEVAENFKLAGKNVTLVEKLDQSRSRRRHQRNR